MQGAGIEATVVVLGKMVAIFGAGTTQMGADCQGLGIEICLTTAADLLVDVVERFGDVERRADADRRAVQVTGTDFRHVTHAVDFFIFAAVLVVVVGFQRQLGAACCALETALMEETEVFEWSHTVHLVHRLPAS